MEYLLLGFWTLGRVVLRRFGMSILCFSILDLIRFIYSLDHILLRAYPSRITFGYGLADKCFETFSYLNYSLRRLFKSAMGNTLASIFYVN